MLLQDIRISVVSWPFYCEEQLCLSPWPLPLAKTVEILLDIVENISQFLKNTQQFYYLLYMQKEDLSPLSTANQLTLTSRTTHSKLWQDSQITGKFVSPQLSFFRERRFKWASIYWPESNDSAHLVKKKRRSQVNQMAAKISKMIDEQQKNEIRIKQIKRTFSIGKSQNGSQRKESHAALSTKKPFKLSKENEEIVKRLSELRDKKQSTLRDRHGNRCNMFEDPESDSTTEAHTFLGMSTGFKTSRKMKLELPHNYFPGPGSYQIKRYLSQLDPKSYEPPAVRPQQPLPQ